MDKIRCTNCRGMKQVAKLGGIMGECNTCNGEGTIKAIHKPMQTPVSLEDVISKELINAVSNALPITAVEDSECYMLPTGIDENIMIAPQVKIDPKKAIYKRKKA